ncbi:MAG TPA: shikimate kinase, partial [Methylophilaceae bacterium]|nr:shikimate kinase [Methylophilaceae bacterium]
KQHGTVVYLRANVHELWQRTRNDKNRPLLQTDDPHAKLEQLFTERDALYSETASIVLDTGGHSVNAIVQHIEQQLCKLSPARADLNLD